MKTGKLYTLDNECIHYRVLRTSRTGCSLPMTSRCHTFSWWTLPPPDSQRRPHGLYNIYRRRKRSQLLHNSKMPSILSWHDASVIHPSTHPSRRSIKSHVP